LVPRVVVGAFATHESGKQAEFKHELEACGIEFEVGKLADDGLTEDKFPTLKARMDFIEGFALRNRDASRLVVTDAWDYRFVGGINGLLLATRSDLSILAADRKCWPQTDCPGWPTESPWKWANAGGFAGTPEQLLQLVGWVRSEPIYNAVKRKVDQWFFNHELLRGPWRLDDQTKVFYTFAEEPTTRTLVDGRNVVTGARPQFLHFNGKPAKLDPEYEGYGNSASTT
jgi:hypothetical protein